MFHAGSEAQHVLHPGGIRKIWKHGLAIWRVAAEEEPLFLNVQIEVPSLFDKCLRHPQFVVVPEPSIHMDGGNLETCPVFVKDVTYLLNSFLIQGLHVFAVVDGTSVSR